MKAAVRSNWERTILVCRKCSKKLDGGFGPDGDERLAKLLRHLAGGPKGRKAQVGVIEVNCLDICPKAGVVLIDAAAPGTWRIVRAGTPVAEVAASLGLG